MARTANKVEDLAREDGELLEALEAVLDVAEDEGTVEWADVSDRMSSGQWGRLIEKGLGVDAGGDGFVVDDPDGVREALSDDEVEDAADFGSDDDSSWSRYDKFAALGAVAMFGGYSIPPVRDTIGSGLNALFGPLETMLPFYVVIMILSVLTGLYSTLLQANLMDMDKMAEYQEQMKVIQEKRKDAKERGDDEALDKIKDEQMDAMGDQMGMFKEQFRPMVWIMLFTIPVFLWMYWKILPTGSAGVTPNSMVMPLIGSIEWQTGVLGPLQAWIVWYFVCSMAFTQVVRKSLNIQTTPST
jgi:uncharacterized membrane protein (DUF106 family)